MSKDGTETTNKGGTVQDLINLQMSAAIINAYLRGQFLEDMMVILTAKEESPSSDYILSLLSMVERQETLVAKLQSPELLQVKLPSDLFESLLSCINRSTRNLSSRLNLFAACFLPTEAEIEECLEEEEEGGNETQEAFDTSSTKLEQK